MLLIIMMTGSIYAGGRFELLSRSLMQNPARTAAVMNGRIILGTGGGIAVYDCADGFSREAFLPTCGEPLDILLKNNTAYIAAYKGGLSVVDLSDPQHPTEHYRFPTLDARFCAFAGERLLLLDVRRGILIFDITSPLEPKLEETIKTKKQLVGIAAESNMIAALTPRLVRIYILDEKVGPWIATDLTTDVLLKRCLIHSGILYLLTVQGDVLRTGLENPIVPKELDPLPISGVVDMFIDSENLLVLTKEGEILSFDIAGGRPSGGRDEATPASGAVEAPPGHSHRIKGGPKLSIGSWFERLKTNAPLSVIGYSPGEISWRLSATTTVSPSTVNQTEPSRSSAPRILSDLLLISWCMTTHSTSPTISTVS